MNSSLIIKIRSSLKYVQNQLRDTSTLLCAARYDDLQERLCHSSLITHHSSFKNVHHSSFKIVLLVVAAGFLASCSKEVYLFTFGRPREPRPPSCPAHGRGAARGGPLERTTNPGAERAKEPHNEATRSRRPGPDRARRGVVVVSPNTNDSRQRISRLSHR